MDSFYNYEITSYDVYRGPNALERFVNKLEEELMEIQSDLSFQAEMIMRPGDYMRHNISNCWICGNTFPDQKNIKTIIYCPNTGNYLGASHRKCKSRNQIIGPKYQTSFTIADKDIYVAARSGIFPIWNRAGRIWNRAGPSWNSQSGVPFLDKVSGWQLVFRSLVPMSSSFVYLFSTHTDPFQKFPYTFSCHIKLRILKLNLKMAL